MGGTKGNNMTLCKWMFPVAIAIAALGTSARAQVVAGPARDLTPDLIAQEYWCRLGANGTKITYESNCGTIDSSATQHDVWMMNLDGTGRQRIAPHLKASEEDGHVSPDGTKVVLHSFANDANSSGQTDIWVYNILTGVYTQMTTNAAYDAYPCWSPDGTKIAFMSQRNKDASQGYNAFIMNADKPENTTDNIPIQLTNFSGYNTATPPVAVCTGQAARIAFMDNTHLMFTGVQSSWKYGTTTFTYPAELYYCETQDTNGDKWGENLTRFTDCTKPRLWNGTGYAIVSNPVYCMGRVFFESNLSPDAQTHEYSCDPSDVNKDVWQVTSAPYQEVYNYPQGDKMVIGMYHNDLNSKGIGTANVDVGLYDLVTDDGAKDSTITANCLAQGFGTYVAGLYVGLWNGGTLIDHQLTDANGNVTFAGLRPGGYILRFQNDPLNTTQTPYSTVNRGCVVAPHSTTNVTAFTAPAAGPRPYGLMATIDGSQVLLIWTANAESTNASTGFTYQGFNVWRSENEDGPYTKINAELVPKTANNVYRWYDANPTDLTKSFYKVTSVTTSIATAPGGAQTLESTPAEFAQAANNLLYNASYESADGTGNPNGWQKVLGTAGTDLTMGVDTSDFITGIQSEYLGAGTTKSGSIWSHSQTQLLTGGPYTFYCVPTDPRTAYVSGAYSRWTGVTKVSANNKSYTQLAYATSEPNAGIPYWYDASTNGTTIASPTGTNTSTPWAWSYQTLTAKAYEFATYTRFSTVAAFDATSIGTTARALFDDAHYQVKRVGPTGIVWGRVADSTPNGVAGVLVTDGTVSTYSGPDGVFALRGVPTGNANISISYPGQTTITQTVSNIGGYRFPTDFTYAGSVAQAVGGKVTFSDGTPVADAHVRIVFDYYATIDLNTVQPAYDAVTDAAGNFTFDFSSYVPDFTKKVWIAATKAGYQSAYLGVKSLALAGTTRFTLALGSAVPVIEVARTSAPPTIDGVVNPSEWQGSSQTALAYKYSSGLAPDVPTKAYALWDNNNLYVAIVATEPNIPGLVAGWTGYEGGGSGTSIWSDDSLQIFLDPTVGTAIGDRRESWQIGINSNQTGIGYADGVIRTGPAVLRLDALENVTGMLVANHVDSANGTWSIEASIPCGVDTPGLNDTYGMTVAPPAVGTEWRGMFARLRAQTSELSSSCNIKYAASYAFSQAELWNTLRFVNAITPTVVKGDLTGDGNVTNADALAALRIAGGLEALAGRTQGDVVGSDNTINMLDAVRLLRKVNGLEPAW